MECDSFTLKDKVYIRIVLITFYMFCTFTTHSSDETIDVDVIDLSCCIKTFSLKFSQTIMDRWLGKTAVVTGAGSGIGKAITHALLQNGINVAALGRTKEKLTKLDAECKKKGFPGKLHTMCYDITREDQIEAAFSHIEKLGGVDIMVNNAGVIEYSQIIDSNRKAFERVLNTNVLAVAVCTNRAVRSMRERNVEGHIFNINSVLSHCYTTDGMSDLDLYVASKHAAVALTHTVRREIAKIKASIRITSINPGLVKTNLNAHSDKMKDLFERMPHLESEDVADSVIYALGARPEVQITELTIQRRGEIP